MWYFEAHVKVFVLFACFLFKSEQMYERMFLMDNEIKRLFENRDMNRQITGTLS